MALVRSLIHALWMLVTVIPVALWMVAATPFASAEHMYRCARFWLVLATQDLSAKGTARSHRR